jgi:anti-sigma factor (TIGR02949 family)
VNGEEGRWQEDNGVGCEDFGKIIDLFLEGELTDQEIAELKRHLEDCELCRSEIKSTEKCIVIMKKCMGDENPPDTMKKKIVIKIIRDGSGDCCSPSDDAE